MTFAARTNRASPPSFMVTTAYWATEEPYSYWPVNPGHAVSVGAGSPETVVGSWRGLTLPGVGQIARVDGYPGATQAMIFIPIDSMPGGADVGASAVKGILINDVGGAITSGVSTDIGSARYWYVTLPSGVPSGSFKLTVLL